MKLCVSDVGGEKKPKKHEQRLLRNMGAHAVVLELLQIPYEKVNWESGEEFISLLSDLIVTMKFQWIAIKLFGYRPHYNFPKFSSFEYK